MNPSLLCPPLNPISLLVDGHLPITASRGWEVWMDVPGLAVAQIIPPS